MMTEEERMIQIGMMPVAVNRVFGLGGVAETGVGRGDVGEEGDSSSKESSCFSSEDMAKSERRRDGDEKP
jgi:hypothetical protein